jgi:hypothetical protein
MLTVYRASAAGCGGPAFHAGTLNSAPLRVSCVPRIPPWRVATNQRERPGPLLAVRLRDLLHHAVEVEAARLLARWVFAKAL